jgi:F-type H+-transporting ATPase subunit delta
MPNPRLATRYAKSLIDLANERNQLEAVYKDMMYLQAVCKKSRDFVSLLRSPVIKPDKKNTIIQAVTKGNVSEMTAAFSRLIVNKGRESYLPEIINAFVDQYNKQNEIHTVKLTTAVPVSEDVKNHIIGRVKSQTKISKIELESAVDEEILGGFLLEMDDILIDASIIHDLNKVKAQFLNNDFIYKIR